MIALDNLTKSFGGAPVLAGLSFEVHTGEAVALWGPNGAGKTTALKCLLGLYSFEGRAVVAGHDVARQGKVVRSLIGYVPQELAFSDMTALETLRFFAGLKKARADRASEALATVGLEEHGSKLVAQLSGGMKQRLALAVALLNNPPILLLDEPTSNLDAAGREAFIRLLVEQKAAGKTILFSSHRLEELEALADRVLVLQGGRLAFECRPDEVAERLALTLRLKLRVPGEQRERALALLSADGYTATPNGHGIWVVVGPANKAAPIGMLARAGVPVVDFEIAAGE